MFSKILLPVAFNRNTRWTADKAIQLANKFGCDIFLLHVISPGITLPFMGDIVFLEHAREKESLQEELRELENYCQAKLNENLRVESAVYSGNLQSVLKDVVIGEHIDLILIPKHRRRFDATLMRRINVDQLSQQTGCPVMTVTRRFNINHLNSIVVPVKDFLPIKKLTLATYFSLETQGSIYLMGTNNDSKAGDEGSLAKAYQLLSGIGHLDVQCALRDDPDMSAGILTYAKNVHADLIVINSGKESRLRGWWNRARGKYLCKESDIPVITVAF